MSKELPRSLYSDEAWDIWEERLLSCDKEDLVELMLMRMANDTRFFNHVYAQFGSGNETDEETSAQIQFYESDMERESYERDPDVEYIISATERFFSSIKNMPGLHNKVKGYISVIIKLEEAVNQGVGYKNDDDWLLFDRITDAKKYCVELVQKEVRTSDQKTQIKNLIMKKMKNYDPVDENHLQLILEKLDTMK